MMTYEMYIPLIAGIIGGFIGFFGGWYLKKMEFNLSKKALRDKKLLEGKISVIHEFIGQMGNVQSMFLNAINFLEEGYTDLFMKFYTEYMFMRLDYQRKISLLFFYLEEESLEGVAEYLECIGEFNKICDNLYVRDSKVTEQELKKLNAVYEKSDEQISIVKNRLREDLGFETWEEIEYEEENEIENEEK